MIEEAREDWMFGRAIQHSDHRFVSKDYEHYIAVHEAAHCLANYILHKEGKYNHFPRWCTIRSTDGTGGYVSREKDWKIAAYTIQNKRSSMITCLASRAAEQIEFGEENVRTGIYTDIGMAYDAAKSIVCWYSGGDQIKGRKIDIYQKLSETKLTEMDKLIDTEIENAYNSALELIRKHKPM